MRTGTIQSTNCLHLRSYSTTCSTGSTRLVTMSSLTFSRVWLIGTNAGMMLSWMRVLVVLCMFYGNNLPSLLRLDNSVDGRNGFAHTLCNDQFVPVVHSALLISFLELFNSITGMTRSKPAQVLLFAIIRFGVEHIVGPAINTCPTAWSHVVTVVCWSLGDSIRFGCFFLDSIASNGSRWAKYVRYTVGPILFPLGTLGEMLMVWTMAGETYSINKLHSIAMYIAALILWPIGFYSLFTQLIRQRQKFLRQDPSTTEHDTKKII